MSLTPGLRLGAYEVLSQLGAGGMGEVYRARDTNLGRDAAGGLPFTALDGFKQVLLVGIKLHRRSPHRGAASWGLGMVAFRTVCSFSTSAFAKRYGETSP